MSGHKRLGKRQREVLFWFEQASGPVEAPAGVLEAVLKLERDGLLEMAEDSPLRYSITELGRAAAEIERLEGRLKAVRAELASDEDLALTLSGDMRACLLAAVRWGGLEQHKSRGGDGRFHPKSAYGSHSSSRATVEALADRGLVAMEITGEEAVPTVRGDRIARSWDDPLLSPGERNWTLVPGGKG